jgi:hypothetical protein
MFDQVGILDYRYDTEDDYRRLAQPGDLIVCYMRPGRALKKRQWIFTLLPHGHAMIVLDPSDPKGILECRFHGIRIVGPDELGLYSYNTVYRLRDAHRLDMVRMREFADYGKDVCQKYSPKSWLGINDELTPDSLSEISDQYTCSTMVVAAYHYAGLTLDIAYQSHRVITPTSIATSTGRWNQFARPLLEVRQVDSLRTNKHTWPLAAAFSGFTPTF